MSSDGKTIDEKQATASPEDLERKTSIQEGESLAVLGYKEELTRNRSLWTLLFQSLAIAAVPYGEGSPLISAIYGGGQLSMFLGWIVVLVLDECVALSLAECASRFPTSGGPSYWSYQLAQTGKVPLAYITGWIWLIGNWTITLSVNFGMAALIGGTIAMYHPDYVLSAWQLLLIFYACCIITFVICATCNKWLPMVDTAVAAWTAVSIIIIMIALSVKAGAGRHSVSYALGNYDTSFAGWGGFTFFIGLLPAAYCFSAIGMISSMAEECHDAAVKVPNAISLCVPVGGIAGLFFIIPLCVTLPPLADVIAAPGAQALPYIFNVVMGTPGGALGLMFLVLVLTLGCSISITVAASRCTWALARDNAIPGAAFWAKVNPSLGIPVNALGLVTIVQMLLGLINLGSTSAFTAFVSVGVQALALAYAIPIAISLLNKREQVLKARWNLGRIIGPIVNVVALAWIAFELVLFSMPTALPVTSITMNYASVVLVGFGAIAAVWYAVHARKCECCWYQHGSYRSLTDSQLIMDRRRPRVSKGLMSAVSLEIVYEWYRVYDTVSRIQ
jgi:amino acid transporter